MTERERWLESLVARCLDAGCVGYRAELDRLCAQHPDAALELRTRIASLEQFGFLDAQPRTEPDRNGPGRSTAGGDLHGESEA